MLSRTVQGRHYPLPRNRGSNRGLVQSFLMIHLTLESPSPWRRWYPLWYMATSDTLAIDAASIPNFWLETWRGISASWVVTEPSANLKRSLKTEQSCYSFKPCCWRTQKAFPTCQNILISPKVSLGSYLGKLLRGENGHCLKAGGLVTVWIHISGKYDDWVPRWPQLESPTQQDHSIF